ncbi:hypothetical protein FJ424_08335 [Mesorhizobium sp. B3-1-8]|uniref:hypothetical protein n=1 Tax=unclassified Mesorhizobium TaxID=325217 RepID=UPI00112E03F4|nr:MULTISPECIES: hypothetical protein [unclassified Mesorhizobium]TPI67964.1 hypothetical protein FJ424_08335 [Mesorhizobium sp. B3-1-8]
MSKTKGALVVIATTHELYDHAAVARGDIEDPAFFPILFETPRKCDWHDEVIWGHVNPGLVRGYPTLTPFASLLRKPRTAQATAMGMHESALR